MSGFIFTKYSNFDLVPTPSTNDAVVFVDSNGATRVKLSTGEVVGGGAVDVLGADQVDMAISKAGVAAGLGIYSKSLIGSLRGRVLRLNGVVQVALAANANVTVVLNIGANTVNIPAEPMTKAEPYLFFDLSVFMDADGFQSAKIRTSYKLSTSAEGLHQTATNTGFVQSNIVDINASDISLKIKSAANSFVTKQIMVAEVL